MSGDGDFHIRVMRPDEIALAVEWAAAEGWNPGDRDAECFTHVDPQGFFIGELRGEPAATISNVNRWCDGTSTTVDDLINSIPAPSF